MSSIYARLGESRLGIIAALGFILQQGVESTVEAIVGFQRPTAMRRLARRQALARPCRRTWNFAASAFAVRNVLERRA